MKYSSFPTKKQKKKKRKSSCGQVAENKYQKKPEP